MNDGSPLGDPLEPQEGPRGSAQGLTVILVIAGIATEFRAMGSDPASELSMTATPFLCEVLDVDDRMVVVIHGEVDVATAPSVLPEQGQITMPSVRNDPLAIEAIRLS